MQECNRPKSNLVRIAFYVVIVGLPVLATGFFFLGPHILPPYMADRDLNFVKNFKLGELSIEEKIDRMENVRKHTWEAGEFGAYCELFPKDGSEPITVRFVRKKGKVYAGLKKTADLFPELPLLEEGKRASP